MRERRSIRLARIAVSSALYIALSLAIAPATFGLVQVRFSEALVLLCFFNKDYCLAMILGCIITNAFSPLGIIDVLFGTIGTTFSVICIRYARKIWLAWIPPVLSMVMVALEFYITASEPFWLSLSTLMAGELIAVGVIGVPLFMLLMRGGKFLEVIGADERFFALSKKKSIRKRDTDNGTMSSTHNINDRDVVAGGDIDDVTSTHISTCDSEHTPNDDMSSTPSMPRNACDTIAQHGDIASDSESIDTQD